jgi:FdhD protein
MKTSAAFPRTLWRGDATESSARELAEETPVALVHDATTTAVMMATPADLEDFGVGFSLNEGIAVRPEDLVGLEVVRSGPGVEVRMWLAEDASRTLAARRRRIIGPTGCGLCGVESLAEAAAPPPRVGTGGRVRASDIQSALRAVAQAQTLGPATRAVHAAAWWTTDGGLQVLREDVGRHNALDKLAGALAKAGARPIPGVLAITSRVSVEMVQKAAVMGAQDLAAISAPTALAVRTAGASGKTLAAVVREDGFEVFTGHERIVA